MIQLKEYIGSLVAEMNNARAIADMKTKQLALAYAEDNVLKHFPVPHFRTPEVELTVPIAIDQLSKADVTNAQIKDKTSFSQETLKVLNTHYKQKTLDAATAKRISSIVSTNINTLQRKLDAGADVKESLAQYGKMLAKDTYTPYKELTKARTATETTLIKNLTKALTPMVNVEKATDLYNSSIIFEAAKLQQMDAKSLIQVKIKMHESGMEWTQVENEDGSVNDKLIPE